MDFSSLPKRPRGESIVPMINVVFLLLIFFLMTSHLAKPEPFEVALPEAASEQEPEAELVLYADKDGQLAYEEMRRDAAWRRRWMGMLRCCCARMARLKQWRLQTSCAVWRRQD